MQSGVEWSGVDLVQSGIKGLIGSDRIGSDRIGSAQFMAGRPCKFDWIWAIQFNSIQFNSIQPRLDQFSLRQFRPGQVRSGRVGSSRDSLKEINSSRNGRNESI